MYTADVELRSLSRTRQDRSFIEMNRRQFVGSVVGVSIGLGANCPSGNCPSEPDQARQFGDAIQDIVDQLPPFRVDEECRFEHTALPGWRLCARLGSEWNLEIHFLNPSTGQEYILTTDVPENWKIWEYPNE